MEEQSDQLEKLKRELVAKAGELAHAQEALSRTEQVPASQGLPSGAGVRLGQARSPGLWVGPYLCGRGSSRRPGGGLTLRKLSCLGRQ